MKYLRIETFALKSASGGIWENDVLVAGKSYKDCFNQALDYLRTQGWASETKLVVCNKNGENFQ